MILARAALCLALAFAGPAFAANDDIAAAAARQIGVTTLYDPAYRKLGFPGGDVPPERGVCTDVVIRALRVARSLDLQRAVHEDLVAHRAAYPKRWAGNAPDRNIDHRRVPNLMTFFTRQGWSRAVSDRTGNYLPGDIVAWDLGGGVLHIGIVSAAKTRDGTPLIVHNIGAGTRAEDILFRFRVIGHYRPPSLH
jgi:uncharacterized protein YijF (DUF1287 family)